MMEIANRTTNPAIGHPPMRKAKFAIGQVVKHRVYPFRGVIFDVDPVFANTEEWLASIPEEVRPRRDQPFYHLLAENAQTTYVAYVSEQNLLPDDTGKPVSHPQVPHFFKELKLGHYVSRDRVHH
jgi:heat shock protein HspQ